jgi:hypothetical protein
MHMPVRKLLETKDNILTMETPSFPGNPLGGIGNLEVREIWVPPTVSEHISRYLSVQL